MKAALEQIEGGGSLKDVERSRELVEAFGL